MSDTDSFIDEVTEEVRRDKLYGYLRRYGWIGVLLVSAIVGGASVLEYRKAQAVAAAQELGDALFAAAQETNPAERLARLNQIDAQAGTPKTLTDLMAATALLEGDQLEDAAARLDAVVENSEIEQIYKDLAMFKAALLRRDQLEGEARRVEFEPFAHAGHPMRMLAEEQLALIDIDEGNIEAAVNRFQSILLDAETTAGLQQRAEQAILALGGTPQTVQLSPELGASVEN
jgi:hypothetical protein